MTQALTLMVRTTLRTATRALPYLDRRLAVKNVPEILHTTWMFLMKRTVLTRPLRLTMSPTILNQWTQMEEEILTKTIPQRETRRTSEDYDSLDLPNQPNIGSSEAAKSIMELSNNNLYSNRAHQVFSG